MAIIYCILNSINSKRYVGQSISSPKIRWQNHLWKLKSNNHYNKHLQAAWNKYGKDAFKFIVILCGNFEVEELNLLEQSYIKLYDSLVNGYNQNEGGYNRKHTSDTKAKLSTIKKELYKNNDHHWVGRKHSKDSKLKMSESRKGSIPWNKGKVGVQINEDVFEWSHKDGTIEQSTQYDLYTKYNLNSSSISKLARGKLKTSYGWKCNGKI